MSSVPPTAHLTALVGLLFHKCLPSLLPHTSLLLYAYSSTSVLRHPYRTPRRSCRPTLPSVLRHSYRTPHRSCTPTLPQVSSVTPTAHLTAVVGLLFHKCPPSLLPHTSPLLYAYSSTSVLGHSYRTPHRCCMLAYSSTSVLRHSYRTPRRCCSRPTVPQESSVTPTAHLTGRVRLLFHKCPPSLLPHTSPLL